MEVNKKQKKPIRTFVKYLMVIIIVGLFLVGKHFLFEYLSNTVLEQILKVDSRITIFNNLLNQIDGLLYYEAKIDYDFVTSNKVFELYIGINRGYSFEEIADKVVRAIIENFPEYKQTVGIKVVEQYIHDFFLFDYTEIKDEIYLSPYGWERRLGIKK